VLVLAEVLVAVAAEVTAAGQLGLLLSTTIQLVMEADVVVTQDRRELPEVVAVAVVLQYCLWFVQYKLTE
jgi:hypothetical protein